MKILNTLDPPKTWCLVVDPENSNKMVLVKWSKSHYAWIGVDLIPMFGFGDPTDPPDVLNGLLHVKLYHETDIKSLSTHFY